MPLMPAANFFVFPKLLIDGFLLGEKSFQRSESIFKNERTMLRQSRSFSRKKWI